ncbi:hypothetical protein CLF_100951 [Clonorchis sinensis]|uniref:Integrase catalytic domain-containing protein n=1 Tax=Clonorchis sinensis TaxID=79923 RepID=G7Y4M0_CLOSI|nr:hypothetical protein CLF_100951 [Clonorchis sinensis]
MSPCNVCRTGSPPVDSLKQYNLLSMSLNFKGTLSSSTRDRYILAIIDEFSEFPFARVCGYDFTTVVDFLTKICLSGMPAYIHSDGGSSFMSSEIDSFVLEKSAAVRLSLQAVPSGEQ